MSSRNDERQPLIAGSRPSEQLNEKGHYNLAGLSFGHFWVLLFSVWVAAFLSAFDTTVVATLLGAISSDFNEANMASWLGTAYLLSVCCFTPIYGRLCNIIGRQASLLVALSFFGFGTAFCGFAPSMNSLIAARAIAGVGGGGITSIGSTIASDLVPISRRGVFQGYANILFGLGVGLGAPMGGLINDTLGWRWAFYLQIPVLAISGTLVYFKVRYTVPSSGTLTPAKQTAREKLARIDFLGCFLLAGFVGALLVAVSLKTSAVGENEIAWSDPWVVGLLVSSAVLFVVFVLVETKVAREPVLPLELLHRRTAVSVAVHNLIMSIMLYAVFYSVPLFYTAVNLMSASTAGNHMIPNAFFAAGASLGSGFLVRATGRYYWLTVIVGLCGVVSCIMLSFWTRESPEWLLWSSFAPLNISTGAGTTLTIVALIADVGRDHVATATSLSYLFRTTGQVLGVSLSGALTQAILARELGSRIKGEGAEEIITSIRQSSTSIRHLSPELQDAATISYQKALHAVFIVCIVLAAITTLAGMGIREVDMNAEPKKVTEAETEDDD